MLEAGYMWRANTRNANLPRPRSQVTFLTLYALRSTIDLSRYRMVWVNSEAAHIWVYLSTVWTFWSCDCDPFQYAQVRMRLMRLNFDNDTRTDFLRTFYGSSSEASFHHCIWRKITNLCQVLLLPTAMLPNKELPIEQSFSRQTLCGLACLPKYTTILSLQQITNGLSTKTCKS